MKHKISEAPFWYCYFDTSEPNYVKYRMTRRTRFYGYFEFESGPFGGTCKSSFKEMLYHDGADPEVLLSTKSLSQTKGGALDRALSRRRTSFIMTLEKLGKDVVILKKYGKMSEYLSDRFFDTQSLAVSEGFYSNKYREDY